MEDKSENPPVPENTTGAIKPEINASNTLDHAFFSQSLSKTLLAIGNITRQSIITMLYGFYPSGLTFKEIKHRLGRIWTPTLLSHLGELQWGQILFAIYAGNDKRRVIEYRLTEFGHDFISQLISSWKPLNDT